MGKACDITLEERAAILALAKASMRQLDIAAQVGRSQSVVSRSLGDDGSKKAQLAHGFHHFFVREIVLFIPFIREGGDFFGTPVQLAQED